VEQLLRYSTKSPSFVELVLIFPKDYVYFVDYPSTPLWFHSKTALIWRSYVGIKKHFWGLHAIYLLRVPVLTKLWFHTPILIQISKIKIRQICPIRSALRYEDRRTVYPTDTAKQTDEFLWRWKHA